MYKIIDLGCWVKSKPDKPKLIQEYVQYSQIVGNCRHRNYLQSYDSKASSLKEKQFDCRYVLTRNFGRKKKEVKFPQCWNNKSVNPEFCTQQK